LIRAVEARSERSGRGDDASWEAQARSCESKLAEIKKSEPTLRTLGGGLAEEACRDQLERLA